MATVFRPTVCVLPAAVVFLFLALLVPASLAHALFLLVVATLILLASLSYALLTVGSQNLNPSSYNEKSQYTNHEQRVHLPGPTSAARA